MLTGTGSDVVRDASTIRLPCKTSPSAKHSDPRGRGRSVPIARGALDHLNVPGNFGRTVSRLRSRLERRPPTATPSIVTPAMASFMVGAIALTVFIAALDPWVTAWMRQSEWAVWRFLHAITHAAKSHFYLIPSGVIVLALAMIDWRQVRSFGVRGRLMAIQAQSLFIFCAIIIPGIGINIVKQLVGRGRPRVFEEYGAFGFLPFEFDSAFQSFPSGHATTSGSLAMLVALFYPRYAVAALICGAGLAFARVPANAHHLSDVVAGYAIGTLATLAMARWLARRGCLFRFSEPDHLPRLIWAGQSASAVIPPRFGASNDALLQAEKEYAR